MYKDKELKKRRDRERQQRRRDAQKGVTSEGVTEGVTIESMIVELAHREALSESGQTAGPTQNTDEQEIAQSTKSDEAIPMAACLRGTPNSVHAVPGDSEYAGVVTPERIAESKRKPDKAMQGYNQKTAAEIEAECYPGFGPEALAEEQEMHQMLRELPLRQ